MQSIRLVRHLANPATALLRVSSPLFIFFWSLFFQQSSIAFPFYTTPESFQTYVNQMWKSGGSGLSDSNFDTNDPTHTGRRYFNFHDCSYRQPHSTSPGALWEQMDCWGYVYHESPIRTHTCKIKATYLAYNSQDYIAANKRLWVSERGSFKMCDE